MIPVTAARILEQAAPNLPDGELLVALSGGADSALAAWLATVAAPERLAGAVFIGHGWDHSHQMQAAARAVATTLYLPLRIVDVPVTHTEGDARIARLAALEAEATAGQWIVTGHHAGDQAETVLLHLLRGAGATGLSGIPMRRHPYVRPLLDVSGDDIRQAAVELDLPFVEDPANRDPAHLRNRVRTELIPQLDRLRPGVSRRLVQTAALLADDDEVIETLADHITVRYAHGEAILPWGALTTAPAPVAARVARRALRTLRPPYGGEAADVTAVVGTRRGSVTELTGGWRAERDGGSIVIYDPTHVPGTPQPQSLSVPGRIDLGRVEVSCSVVESGDTVWGDTLRIGRDSAVVSAELADHLIVRATEPGERIDIGTGSKLVRDAMAEAGIPPRLRTGWPVVAAHGKIAWLAGARVATWASVGANPGSLRLSMERR